MKDFTSKSGFCSTCKQKTRFLLHMQLMQSGARHFLWVCQTCNTRNPGSGPYYISAELIIAHLSTNQIESLPVIMPDLSNRCAVCGKREAELHHWAPKALFGKDSGDWPKDYLCKEHHNLWHLKVTPQLIKDVSQ
jgi:hypothetical protein